MAEEQPTSPLRIPLGNQELQSGSGEDGSSNGSWQNSGLVVNLEADSSSDRSSTGEADEGASIATSLSSSAMEFRYEHGRRYNAYADSTYVLPNDETEAERLSIQHLIWSKCLNGRLYLSPLPEDITDAVDIGCGTGAWAIDFANLHPNANVIGTDLSPIQPLYVPVNCSWLVDDANNPWPSEFHGKFDLVHARAIGMGVRNWDHFIDQAWNSLKPGGWFETHEFYLPLGCDDGSATGTALEQWGFSMRDAGARIGVNVAASLEIPRRLRDRGFHHVREVRLKGPIGPWAKGRVQKELGILGRKDLYDDLAGLSKKLFAVLGYTPEQTDDLCERAKQDMLNRNVHTYMPLTVSWAQKPFIVEPTHTPQGQ